MLTVDRKHDLIKRAQSLATNLNAGEVTRSELRPVLNALFLPATPWSERLEKARQLLEILPESWVASRSGKTRPQLARVRGTLRSILQESLREEELRFLLGWTSRLVHIPELEKKQRERLENRRSSMPGADLRDRE
jgi:hypothetical protein